MVEVELNEKSSVVWMLHCIEFRFPLPVFVVKSNSFAERNGGTMARTISKIVTVWAILINYSNNLNK